MDAVITTALDSIPRLGWPAEPTPLDERPALAAALGLDRLWVKRDDLAGPIRGGSKVRKLDVLLADPRFCEAPAWASVGAIGSSHLLALADAASLMSRSLHAYTFDMPPSHGVQDVVRAISAGSAHVYHRRTRTGLALRWPRAVFGPSIGGVPVIPAGGTDAVGTVGMIRGGLEFVSQIREQASDVLPDRLYIAVGSGGGAAGVSIALGLAHLPIEVHAVSTVERHLLSRRRFDRVVGDAVRLLFRDAGPPTGFAPARVHMRRGFLGRGYGVATADSDGAAARLRAHGLPGEPIYTGKALACLEHDARAGVVQDAVFWMTAGPVSAIGSADSGEAGSG